ncbi:MAG: transcriptional regulator [Acidobacteria bacterium]|nr:MAG: transcriptional regulator [Acidobacteriota bacterium]
MAERSEFRFKDVGSFIREQRNAAEMSLRKLADQAGVSNPYLSQIERGLRKPSAEILQAIAKALRISAETLYLKAGILEERDDEGEVVEAILRDATITDRQKQNLIDIYESFRKGSEKSEALTDETKSSTESAVDESSNHSGGFEPEHRDEVSPAVSGL